VRPDSVLSHERSVAPFADLNRIIERQQQNGQTTAQNGRRAAAVIGPTVHHVDSRRACGCGARVFTYADELDDDGNVLRHLCSRCARVARREPVCRICGERIDETEAGWRHVHVQRRHRAAPLAAID
jgi:hypothetical protein